MKAFSLAELMIGIGTIAVALLLVALAGSKARQLSLDTRCLSHLRDVGVAMALFANDHRQSIMPRLYNGEFTSSGDAAYTHWHRRLGRGGYLPAINKAGDNEATYCPSFRPVSPYDTSVENPTRSMHRYGLRNWAPSYIDLNDPDQLLPLSSIEDPADFFIVADSYYVSDQTQGYQISQGNASWRIHLRHGGRAHALFADGHVAAKDREYFQELHLRQKYAGKGSHLPFYLWPEEP